ncbi:unnamed protein product [Ixodes hexagonus]
MSATRRVPAYQLIDGVRQWLYTDPAVAHKAVKFEVQEGDVVLVTYPKCGTHWVTQIIDLILHKGDSASGYRELASRATSLENYGIAALEDSAPPRLIQSHYQLLRNKLNPRAKYIYVARNPWDCCVSYFHMCRGLPWFKFQDGSFDDFFEAFMAGELSNGDYFEHVLHGYARRDEPNVFVLTYESLKADTPGMILKLAYFLGDEHGKMLEQDEDLLRTVMSKSSLEFMGRILEPKWSDFAAIVPNFNEMNFTTNGTLENERLRNFKIFRKGKVNAWKEQFTPEQALRLLARLKEKAPELIGLWDARQFIVHA